MYPSNSQVVVSMPLSPFNPLALARTPFDALRANYASAARAGLIKKSMLASRDFDQAVGVLERLMLGPLARQV